MGWKWCIAIAGIFAGAYLGTAGPSFGVGPTRKDMKLRIAATSPIQTITASTQSTIACSCDLPPTMIKDSRLSDVQWNTEVMSVTSRPASGGGYTPADPSKYEIVIATHCPSTTWLDGTSSAQIPIRFKSDQKGDWHLNISIQIGCDEIKGNTPVYVHNGAESLIISIRTP